MNEHSWRPVRIAAAVLGGITLALVLAFVFGYFVMILWNWLMPEIFGLPSIGYWQGWGLILLSHILLKPGHHPGGGRLDNSDRRRRREEWKKRMKERFAEHVSESAADADPGETS